MSRGSRSVTNPTGTSVSLQSSAIYSSPEGPWHMPNVLTISFRGSTTVRECQCVGCQILCLHWWAQRYVPTYQFRLHTNIKSQLYAALHEWRSGVHHATDFSTDAYMDAYDGHTGTLTHLRTERPRAYQVMMTELYDLARCVTLVLYYDHR